VFAPTRRLSCLWARLLAELELEAPPARVALARLTHQEPTRSIASMRFCFERGVAFHNADLHSGLRHLIEQSFNEGQLRVIVCTPTLGQGVNLAARNVLQFPWRIQSRSGSGRPYTLRLGRSRFSNQGGRAARFGLGENEGRSMVVAATTGEAQQFWNELMEGKDEATDLPLISMTLPSIVLDLLTACPRKTTLDVRDALRGTYSALRAELSRLALFSTGGPKEVEDALDRLSRADLIRWDPAASAWAMTGLGEVAVCQGLSIATVAYLRRELEEGNIFGQPGLGHLGLGRRGASLPIFEIYLALALTEEGREASSGRGIPRRRFLPPLSRGEEPGEDPGEINELDSPLPRSFFKQPGGTSREQIMALNAASILTDWVHGVGTEELEARYGVQYGSLANLAAQFVWLLRALAGIAAVLRRPRPVVEGLQRLAERTLLGIPEEGVDLARLRVRHLGRGAIQRLLGEGCSTPEDLAGAGCEYLARLVGQDLAKQLEGAALKAIETRSKNSEARGRIAGERSPTIVQEELPLTRGETPAPPPSSLPDREDHLLEINLQSPGIIQARGKEVFLPPLSFELLAAMAERPGEVVTRLALYMRLWPEGGPEDQQLDEHRRNLLRRLRPALGDRTESIFEVVRGIGFRLALSPEQVGLRR
ncbi:winged helix-turn-helix domain-containing protein, partial [Candidatus Sumerlaeota bacterium]|nr:winged helix-turn-helix domain-containing protein [Candidatus Sumerlaeota bacterium]